MMYWLTIAPTKTVMVSEANHPSIEAMTFWNKKACHAVVRFLAPLG
jgi:hypothetical protein